MIEGQQQMVLLVMPWLIGAILARGQEGDKGNSSKSLGTEALAPNACPGIPDSQTSALVAAASVFPPGKQT